LFNALLYAPLYFAPFFMQRPWWARAGAACLLLPAFTLQAIVAVSGTLVLRLNDGIVPWTWYLVSLACLIVLVAAMVVLLSPKQPRDPDFDELNRTASGDEPERTTPEPNAAVQ
jgi:hypothetical protein